MTETTQAIKQFGVLRHFEATKVQRFPDEIFLILLQFFYERRTTVSAYNGGSKNMILYFENIIVQFYLL